jgi:hypothetical protein
MGKKAVTDTDFGLEIIGIERVAEFMNQPGTSAVGA